MTELQTGLIGLGVLAVGGVLAYNKWQEIRHRKVAEAVLKPAADDVLLGGAPRPVREPVAVERNEPAWHEPAQAAEMVRDEPVFVDEQHALDVSTATDAQPVFVAEEAAPAVVGEPMLSSPVRDMPFELPQAAIPEVADVAATRMSIDREPGAARVSLREIEPGEVPPELLDPRLEFIVTLDMLDPVPARQIVLSQRETLQKLHKPVHWVGYNEASQQWEKLQADSPGAVNRLRVGLQLVNRLGPVSGGDIAVFTGAMQALADELMAVLNMPSTRLLDQAAQLDAFCASVDLEIGLNLVSQGQVFPGTKIRALAESAGMVLGADGLFTRFDDGGRPLFYLQNYESTAFSADTLRNLNTHGLTFLLDVPRVAHGEKVFNQMIELARRFADALHGVLVDDNRQPLGETQLDHIRREFIGKPQVTMIQFGMPAGSAQAIRLFS
ncbi:MAG: cell division protein FtsZ [Azonexus sp.]|nr:cell division protein FtsZ [Azonexus sp.]